MTKDEALKLALKALRQRAPLNSIEAIEFDNKINQAITAIKEALSSCQCQECKVVLHASDCAVHNEPAYPKGECDCGAQSAQQQEPAFWTRKQWGMDREFCEKPFTTDWEPLYTTPPQRKPLTAMEVYDVVHDADLDWHTGFALGEDENRFVVFARAIEAAHQIKGEA